MEQKRRNMVLRKGGRLLGQKGCGQEGLVRWNDLIFFNCTVIARHQAAQRAVQLRDELCFSRPSHLAALVVGFEKSL